MEAKRRDEDAALTQRDELPEGLADEPLGAGDSRPLGVRGVTEQEVDAAVADLGQVADVGAQAVHRRVVDLVVARVHDAAARGLEHDRDRVGDRVRDADELRRNGPS